MPVEVSKPVDRHPDHLKKWIIDVYEKKLYQKEANKIFKGKEEIEKEETASEAQNCDDAVAVIPLSSILGSDTPILTLSLQTDDERKSKGKHDKIDTCDETSNGEQKTVQGSILVQQTQMTIDEWDPFGIDDSMLQPSFTENEETGGTLTVDSNLNAAEEIDDEREDEQESPANAATFKEEGWQAFVQEADERTETFAHHERGDAKQEHVETIKSKNGTISSELPQQPPPTNVIPQVTGLKESVFPKEDKKQITSEPRPEVPLVR